MGAKAGTVGTPASSERGWIDGHCIPRNPYAIQVARLTSVAGEFTILRTRDRLPKQERRLARGFGRID